MINVTSVNNLKQQAQRQAAAETATRKPNELSTLDIYFFKISILLDIS